MKKQNILNYMEISEGIFKDGANNIYILNSKRDTLLKLDKSKQPLFQLMRSRLVLSILVGALIIYYLNNPLIGLCAGLVIFIILELYFRNIFLNKLIPFQKLSEPVKRKSILNKSNNLSKETLIKNVILSILISIIFVWNWIENEYSLIHLFNIENINKMIGSWLSIIMIIFPIINTVINIRIIKNRS